MTELPRKRHVQRSMPPWRSGVPVAECGLKIDPPEMITREEAATLGVDKLCQTCANVVARHRTFEDHPVAHLVREAGGQYLGIGGDCAELADELRTLALLVDRHREEWEEMIRVPRLARRLQA